MVRGIGATVVGDDGRHLEALGKWSLHYMWSAGFSLLFLGIRVVALLSGHSSHFFLKAFYLSP